MGASNDAIAEQSARLHWREALWREEAEERTARLAAIVECSPDAMYSSRDRRITSWNHGAEVLYGYRAAEVLGEPVEILYPPGRSDELDTIVARLGRGDAVAAHRTERRRKDGSLVQVWLSLGRIDDDTGHLLGIAAVGHDISGTDRLADELRASEERYRSIVENAEEELAYRALHDPLTGLPNRALLSDRIEHALTRNPTGAPTLAILSCDLDGFKVVNSSFGHQVGDHVLRVVGERLVAAVRPADTVARLGGDEFVVFGEDIADESAALALAARLRATVAQPIQIAGAEVEVTCSVGVALAPADDAAALLSNADAAMGRAKQAGRDRTELFDEELSDRASERIRLLADLRHAVARDQLRLYYQPVMALDGEVVVGAEALVRWQHPQRGLLTPDTFIGLAEDHGLIVDIGRWVLGEACRQAALWVQAGPGRSSLDMAVNVSARQLAPSAGLVECTADTLRASGVDPTKLVLEITESALLGDADAALRTIGGLKALGVRLAIDDFGTGYSSLVYLKRFPVGVLKIDKAFIDGLGHDPDDTAIVASVIGLARAVGIDSVAEGVETACQLAALRQLGCGFAQGYLWSRPVPAVDFEGAFLQMGEHGLR